MVSEFLKPIYFNPYKLILPQKYQGTNGSIMVSEFQLNICVSGLSNSLQGWRHCKFIGAPGVWNGYKFSKKLLMLSHIILYDQQKYQCTQ